jgi:hypothetical protein
LTPSGALRKRGPAFFFAKKQRSVLIRQGEVFQEFCEAKLRKTKTAKRFWFAQGIGAVSFFCRRQKKIQADSPVFCGSKKCAQN